MKNVVIVATDFPPLNTISSRRFGELCSYMEDHSFRPWVLTKNAIGPLLQPIPQERVFRTTENVRSEGQKISWASDRFIYKKLSDLGFRSLLVERQLLSWVQSAQQLMNEMIEKIGKVSLVIGTYGPPSALYLAGQLAKKANAPWVADFRDLGATRSDQRNFLVRAADILVERRLVESATAMTTVSPTLADILKATYQKPTEVVYNGFDFSIERQELAEPARVETFQGQKYIYYAGQIYPHQMKSIELLFEAIQSFSSLNLVFRILGPSHLVERLRSMAKRMRLEDRIQFFNQAEPEVILYEAKNAYVNVVFEELSREQEWTKGTITGKLPRLLPMNPAILTIARSDSNIAPILKETQKGVVCDNLKELNEFFNLLSQNVELYRGRVSEIEKYSKKSQARRLCEFLSSVAS